MNRLLMKIQLETADGFRELRLETMDLPSSDETIIGTNEDFAVLKVGNSSLSSMGSHDSTTKVLSLTEYQFFMDFMRMVQHDYCKIEQL
jgi:hypothetical protein